MFVDPENRRELENDFNTPKKYLAFFRGTINHRDGWAYSRGLWPRLQKLLVNETDVIYDTKHSTCDVDNIVEILRSFSEEERTKKLEAIDGVWMMFTY